MAIWAQQLLRPLGLSLDVHTFGSLCFVNVPSVAGSIKTWQISGPLGWQTVWYICEGQTTSQVVLWLSSYPHQAEGAIIDTDGTVSGLC